MKLTDILLNEYGEFRQQENELEAKVKSALTKDFHLSVSIGAYSGGRPEDDPLKDKGFGSLSFIEKEDIPEDEFNKVINIINSSGYEVDEKQSTRFYDYEPGERDYYPKIKFGFKIK